MATGSGFILNDGLLCPLKRRNPSVLAAGLMSYWRTTRGGGAYEPDCSIALLLPSVIDFLYGRKIFVGSSLVRLCNRV